MRNSPDTIIQAAGSLAGEQPRTGAGEKGRKGAGEQPNTCAPSSRSLPFLRSPFHPFTLSPLRLAALALLGLVLALPGSAHAAGAIYFSINIGTSGGDVNVPWIWVQNYSRVESISHKSTGRS